MKKFILVTLIFFLQVSMVHAAAGFSGWRKIVEIYSAGTDGGVVIVLDRNMDNSFCNLLDRGYIDPAYPSYKTILALATSAFMAGKDVELYTQSCQTIWGTQYTVFDRIRIR